MALIDQGGILDRCHRCLCGQSREQAVLNATGATHTHVDGQGQVLAVGGLGELGPVGARATGPGMPSNEQDTTGVLPVGQRDAQRSHRCET